MYKQEGGLSALLLPALKVLAHVGEPTHPKHPEAGCNTLDEVE